MPVSLLGNFLLLLLFYVDKIFRVVGFRRKFFRLEVALANLDPKLMTIDLSATLNPGGGATPIDHSVVLSLQAIYG